MCIFLKIILNLFKKNICTIYVILTKCYAENRFETWHNSYIIEMKTMFSWRFRINLFRTILSMPLISIAGGCESSPCFLPFLSFHVVDSVAWNTYRSRKSWVVSFVWSVSSRITSSHLLVYVKTVLQSEVFPDFFRVWTFVEEVVSGCKWLGTEWAHGWRSRVPMWDSVPYV